MGIPAGYAPMPPMPAMPTMPALAPMPAMDAMDVWESLPAMAPMPPMPADALGGSHAAMPPPALAEVALLADPGDAQDDDQRRAQEDAQRAREEAQRAREEAQRGREEAQRAREEERRYQERDESDYRHGKSYLDRKSYDKAIDAFNRVIENKGSRADGALYWRAYAQNKLGKRDEALASLSELQKTYPKSRWLDDAKALEVEIRQKSGQPVSPESTADEDLKLMALQALSESDPERSIPMLEKILQSNNSPKLKERALFVLAQSHGQKSREVLASIAKGGSNPDLQSKAIEYLGVYGGHDNLQILVDVYKSSNDAQSNAPS